MKYLSLQIPDTRGTPVVIQPPPGIPSGPQFSIGNIASVFIALALVVGIFLSLGYLLYGGFYWVQSGGDKQKLDKARRTIIYSIVGLIIMSLALVIVNVIVSSLGVSSVFPKN
ncbi:MAG: hypothetical protein A3C27_03230 [Candidatus Levybacteria bacterium RIFCSPHIGHO2_02_FULL_39_36]|nr:MAG: hypothetical protein UT20_C0026G0003 [Candidatus Levybacteria bacterium GW2011_GWA1_39_11]KKR49658.1 MAG: hypothetical protein UT85_C0013G0003 [Candidatus Levybacteria bacterium GW2011_GWA2_40_16]OGH27946.1 MAG: hypothetical protein A3C27_03230 [Candidatus Levybacteria bacterium RIFCSPHIGHO2_02_FULL_39_36]OGH48348.1 MAG: hypothetical protein A3G66_01645 [Candidatus Levybacteria bacterium RIFCSPLOWO2_12_FULL_39_17]